MILIALVTTSLSFAHAFTASGQRRSTKIASAGQQAT